MATKSERIRQGVGAAGRRREQALHGGGAQGEGAARKGPICRELTPLEGSRGRRDLGVRDIFFLLQIMIWFFELQTA